MLRVKLSTNVADVPLLRQTPGWSGIWGDCQFDVDQTADRYDAWIVYEGLNATETAACPAGSTIFVTGEPPEIRSYEKYFVKQFDTLVTSQAQLRHPGLRLHQQALPWHVGVDRSRGNAVAFDYDTLGALPRGAKPKLLSVICSDKRQTEGHRRRVEFVSRLQNQYPGLVDVFGRGHRTIGDKWEALAAYRYHLVIENSRVPHYWTEKLADAYLAWSYPIYYGCPNLDEYFSPGAFTPLDIADFEGALATIEQVLAEQLFERRQAEIEQARRQVLDRHNMFALFCELVHGLPRTGPAVPHTILPEDVIRPPRYERLIRKVRRKLPAVFRRKRAA